MAKTNTKGINGAQIDQTPIAVIDVETTGLTPGYDRIVEISVFRKDPGRDAHLAMDTLVNPRRRMAATEIHGITDADVADAPTFNDVAGDVVTALSGCVLSAYNVYFDMGFIQYELENAGVRHEPPHVCLMYLRPMLGLGSRCKLCVACAEHRVPHTDAHMAGHDAQACCHLLNLYLDTFRQRGIATYGELARLKKYKFIDSFRNGPYQTPAVYGLRPVGQFRSRFAATPVQAPPPPPRHLALRAYWKTLVAILEDFDVTDEECDQAIRERTQLGLTEDEIRTLHARVYSGVITRYTADQRLDQRETQNLRRLTQCLSKLGWAPGE